MATHDFSGEWHCRYWFPSNQHDGEDVSEYKVKLFQKGNELILESLPNEEKSYMSAHMVIDSDSLNGNWQENTSSSGEFAGSIYTGAMYLLSDETGDSFDGKWVGLGQENGKQQVYTGRWQISRK